MTSKIKICYNVKSSCQTDHFPPSRGVFCVYLRSSQLFLMLSNELYKEILKAYKESGSELYDAMFLTADDNYVGGYKHRDTFTPYRSQSILNDF